MSDEKEKGKETVLFVCDRYPEIRLVFKADTTTIVNGKVVTTKAHYIGFRKTNYGGQYETSDAEQIEFIRSTPEFKQGEIVEVKNIDDIRSKAKTEDRVRAGQIGTAANENQTQPPAEAPKPAAPKAATAPGKKKQPAAA